jgi:hypothetical protein
MTAERRREFEERRRSLNERGDELNARLARLRSRDPATAMDLQGAKEMVASALRHSVDAHVRTAVAYQRAAMAHRQAAEYADLVGDRDGADEHRTAATADDEAAEFHLRAAEADRAAIMVEDPNDLPSPA